MDRRRFLTLSASAGALNLAPGRPRATTGASVGRGILYPQPLRRGDTIGITAPSAGVGADLEPRLRFCLEKLRALGYVVREGQVLRSDEMVSAPAYLRAAELQGMLLDDSIQAIVPPWGGELLIDILPLLDWAALAAARPKWFIGYSDLSTFMLAYTVRTHIATLNGSCLLEAPIHPTDPALAYWNDVATLAPGAVFVQHAASHYQAEDVDWAAAPLATQFSRTEPVRYKLLKHEEDADAAVTVRGRLLGGTLDVIAMLAGSVYGDVRGFVQSCAPEGLLIYLDNADMNSAQYCRLLHHLKLAGWFDHANAVLVGRTGGEQLREFTVRDALLDAVGDLAIPVLYDLDIGHLPPQLILVNGALATVHFEPMRRRSTGRGPARGGWRPSVIQALV